MEAFLGYWVLACIALMFTMPLTALAITSRRNKQSDERLRMAILKAIAEEQKKYNNT